MATAQIGPDQNARIRYRVPKDRTIEFSVQADRSVKTYVMTKKGCSVGCGKRFKYTADSRASPDIHRQELILPFGSYWYLVIVNPNKARTVEAEYEVFC